MKSNELINDLLTLEEVTKLVQSGKYMILAGDESLLDQVPKGNWIGGTIPYFMSPTGGMSTKEKIFVTLLPPYLENLKLITYTVDTIKKVYNDAPENGLSFIIIPSSSEMHMEFAINGPEYENFAVSPLFGWVAGFHLNDMAKAKAKVFNGSTGEKLDNDAVVIHGSLPPTKYAEINIINIFEQGKGDIIEVLENGFSIKDALVNGVKRNFYDYLMEVKHDVRFPLIANYLGVMLNISYQRFDEENKIVYFYAPVFKGVQYRNADDIKDYVTEYTKLMPTNDIDNISFSCNCILNYVHSELDGKITKGVTGPLTFGEIAYQVINQTMVYLMILDHE